MIEFATRITNQSSATLILFQINAENQFGDRQVVKDLEETNFLRERPGLKSITYSARVDKEGQKRIVPSMCEMALQMKEANVNILRDFVLELTTLTPLYPGHKPTPKMIDIRTKKHFENIKANKDKKTLKFDIYSTQPKL